MKFPNGLLGLQYLTKEDINSILNEAKKFKKEFSKNKLSYNLKNKTVVNLFFENSTRTRVSFELSERLLEMNVVNFNSDVSSLSKGESFLDTIRNINAMQFEYIVLRHYSSGLPLLCSKYLSNVKIINAGDGSHEHPTQGLLDIFTLKEHFGELKNLRVCIIGNISHSRVALSNIYGLKKTGAIVSVCGPKSFIPKKIENLDVKIYNNLGEAIQNNDVLNIMRVQLERNAGYLLPSLKEYNKFYGVSKERLELNPQIIILHPGPTNNNVEINEDIIANKNSLIFDQVTNGIAVKLALFKLMS